MSIEGMLNSNKLATLT